MEDGNCLYFFLFFCRYECIENDLLGSLQFTIHTIAPYQSKGIEKAEELSVGWSTQAPYNDKCQKAADEFNGRVIWICFNNDFFYQFWDNTNLLM